jgi:hypothetical protein
MRVPISIPLAGRRLRVSYVERLADDIFAEFCEEAFRVRVSCSRHVTAKQVWRSLYHELNHAVMFLAGYTKKLSDEDEESIVTALDNFVGPIVAFAPPPGTRWREVAFPFED